MPANMRFISFGLKRTISRGKEWKVGGGKEKYSKYYIKRTKRVIEVV